jgi:hypothetical protein
MPIYLNTKKTIQFSVLARIEHLAVFSVELRVGGISSPFSQPTTLSHAAEPIDARAAEIDNIGLHPCRPVGDELWRQMPH